MTCLGKYETGDPVILVNADKLGKYGLRKNTKGTANTIVTVDGKRIVSFMPSYTMEMFFIEADRCVLDEQALEDKLPKES